MQPAAAARGTAPADATAAVAAAVDATVGLAKPAAVGTQAVAAAARGGASLILPRVKSVLDGKL